MNKTLKRLQIKENKQNVYYKHIYLNPRNLPRLMQSQFIPYPPGSAKEIRLKISITSNDLMKSSALLLSIFSKLPYIHNHSVNSLRLQSCLESLCEANTVYWDSDKVIFTLNKQSQVLLKTETKQKTQQLRGLLCWGENVG